MTGGERVGVFSGVDFCFFFLAAVGTENFALQEYIFVNHDNIPHGIDIPHMDDTKFWVARVLEIRAVDEAHVYLRVYWLYWPEELPGGRQPYHGAKELVASNHMEIIDAMTVSGRASVKHWMELDDEEGLPDLFWRQKFDFPTGTLMVRSVILSILIDFFPPFFLFFFFLYQGKFPWGMKRGKSIIQRFLLGYIGAIWT